MTPRKRITLATLSCLALAVGAYLAFTAPPPVDWEALDIAAQKYRVEIARDSYGIPHIFGHRDADTAFGLAYAQAEDDFLTLQEIILATRGRLAAVKGPTAAPTDYLISMMGVWEAVDAGYMTELDQHTRDIAEAYAAGVNLYAAQHPEQALPYAFPVTGRDLVAGFTFKSPLFYGFDKVLGELMGGTPRELARQGDNALTFTSTPQPEIGSQGIAVAAHRSNDDTTRLLINSHQPLTGPVAWYEASLHSDEGWATVGGTFPGSPVILHGHNAHLGWANTVNKPDLVDIYQLTINPENENQYRLDGEWRELEIKQAEILVKLLGPLRWLVKEPVYYSAHGPVIKTERGSYALRWSGRGDIRMLEQMIRLNKATTQQEFEGALAMGAQPSINYVYADREGNIAHYYNALFPDRLAGWDWQKDLPGDRSELIWERYLPFSRIPKTVNPPSGVVFNANNSPYLSTDGSGAPEPGDFPATMGVETRTTNRALRIKRLFSGLDSVSREDFRRIKYDISYDQELAAIAELNKFLAAGLPPGNEDLESAFALLANWDYAMGRDSTTAALALLTLEPLIDSRHKREDVDLLQQLAAARDYLIKHFGRLDIAFGDINRLQRGAQEWPLDGGPDLLRAVYGNKDAGTGKLIDAAGDSFIMFVEWDKRGNVSSRAVHNFGSATQDANSPHYADQAPIFAAMRERPVYLDREQLMKNAERSYTPQSPDQPPAM
jgi:acyl-homoserine-lactone acylase